MENDQQKTNNKGIGSGEDALTQYLVSKYGRLPDGSWKSMLLGARGLSSVAYYNQEKPNSHWLFVTYGFTELDGKVTDDPEVSGSGFELTFRLKKESDEKEPAIWVRGMMDDYADYVFSTWKAFKPLDYMEYPLNADIKTNLAGALFIPDSELGTLKTTNGSFTFLEVVPVVADELSVLKGDFKNDDEYNKQAMNIAQKLASTQTNLYITDIGR